MKTYSFLEEAASLFESSDPTPDFEKIDDVKNRGKMPDYTKVHEIKDGGECDLPDFTKVEDIGKKDSKIPDYTRTKEITISPNK